MHAKIPAQVGGRPVRTIVEILNRDTAFPISLEYIPKSEPVICNPEDWDETDGIPCAYVTGRDSLYNVVLTIVQMLNYEKRGEYTFILDHGTIRILKTDKAIEWWRKNILTKTN